MALTEQQVVGAYLRAGYSKEKAEQMAKSKVNETAKASEAKQTAGKAPKTTGSNLWPSAISAAKPAIKQGAQAAGSAESKHPAVSAGGSTVQKSDGSTEAYQQLLQQYAASAAGSAPDYSDANEYLERQAESQKKALDDSYERGARDAYIVYMQGLRQLPKQLAAAGLRGSGLAETSQVGLNAEYGNNLAALRAARDSGLLDIDQDVAGKIYSTMISQANAKAAGQNAYAEQLADLAKEISKGSAESGKESSGSVGINVSGGGTNIPSGGSSGYDTGKAVIGMSALAGQAAANAAKQPASGSGVALVRDASGQTVVGRYTANELAKAVANGTVEVYQNGNGSLQYRKVK